MDDVGNDVDEAATRRELIELGAEHRLERLDLQAGAQKSPEYLKLNAGGVVPTLLIDGDGNCELGAVDAVLTAEKLSALYGYPLRQFQDSGRRSFIPD